jgi:Aspartyl/Asparaginyl beta-hydroxylase
MASELRQRRGGGGAASASMFQVVDSGIDDKKDSRSSPTHSESLSTSKKTLLVLACGIVYLFFPVLIYVPQALYIFAASGFDVDEFLGPGLRNMVGNLVKDPEELIAWGKMAELEANPTTLVRARDAILQEYEDYRSKYSIPILSEMDPEEQEELDPKHVWKTLFLRAMGRETCVAKLFPKTIAAVKASGYVPYSIMISRMAPGQTIEPHTGFSKFIQIYHMSLTVPNNNVTTEGADYPPYSNDEVMSQKPYLQVQDCHDYHTYNRTNKCDRIETYHWKEGQEFIFDDSFPHWTHNPTQEERLILFLHIHRIDFKGWKENLIARILLSAFNFFPFPGVMKLVRGHEATCQAMGI